jgi:hypothetical protein
MTTDPYVLLACPSRWGTKSETTKALLRVAEGLPRLGVRWSYVDSGTTGLTVARSLLAARFLRHEHATHMLFVDDDVCGFHAADVARMAHAGEDIVGAPLPKRSVHPGCVENAVKAGVVGMELLRFLSPLMFVPKVGDGVRVRGSLLEVELIGTGFLLLSRRAVQEVADACDSWGTFDDELDLQGQRVPFVFDYGINGEGKFVGEDFGFCLRWKSMAAEGEERIVWADVDTELAHLGEQIFWSNSLRKIYNVPGSRPKPL